MAKKSWVAIPENCDFTLENLPYGIFRRNNEAPRPGVAIGEHILRLDTVAALGFFDDIDCPRDVFSATSLNPFIARGKGQWSAVRKVLQRLLADGDSPLKAHQDVVLVAQKDVRMEMPVEVGDYTDFYSSIEHATNVGKMFRDPENALLPNWKHLPVGYHGRASSLIVSGTPVRRPCGQTKAPDAAAPTYGPSKRLDFELEMAFVVGRSTDLGSRITTTEAEEAIFGVVLFNDWSARDIQKWEYVPLGPFLGKSFASSISPWIVPLEALEPFRVSGPAQSPEVLEYLRYEGDKNFDISLEVGLTPADGEETIICRSNFKHMYWNMAQQLAHHTVNGCNVRVGDMMASGTISGKDDSSFGSMLELSWAGSKPVPLNNGQERKFLQDGDTITMRGSCQKGDIRIGFGEVSGTVLPAQE